jgi:hypothetical protein
LCLKNAIMSKIVFDQPSTGNVNSAADALAVVNQGRGNAVTGNSREGAAGVFGLSEGGVGVRGESQKVRIDEDGNYAITNDGVFGLGKNGVHGQSASVTDSGVWGENSGAGYGVAGSTNSPNAAGVWGDNRGAGHGVKGTSADGEGVHGESHSQTFAGVAGIATNLGGNAPGVWAESRGQGPGLVGKSVGFGSAPGVWAEGGGGPGLFAVSQTNEGVHAESKVATWAAVSATNKGQGPGLWASGAPAGHFEGDVEVTGDIRLLNADCAEDFDLSGTDKIDPGTVMVIDDEGVLCASEQAYDKRVAGVISGAGGGRPAIVLDKQNTDSNRMPIGLVGKVYCRVDAQYSPIEVGDLLTTSPTRGHAMKADDPLKSFGSVIGKALRPLNIGQGLIPILIALQ